MATSNRSTLFGVLAAAAIFAGIAAGTYFLGPQPQIMLASGTLLPTPRPVMDFNLVDEDSQPYTRAQLDGRWTIIFAGYTHCPDVCPTTMQTLKVVKSSLGADADKLGVLFISVDPARDPPPTLAQYVHYFGADFHGATGDDAELEKLGKDLGFVYLKVPGTTPDNYLMDHSAALMLINPKAELAGYLSPPFDAATIAKDLKNLIENAS